MKLPRRGKGGRNGKGEATYTVHMNTRLTPEQAAAVRASGLKDSECIRLAVQQWIERGEYIRR